jgi:predicted AlkP superfamily pyrophosphatase or phosphodiesterase
MAAMVLPHIATSLKLVDILSSCFAAVRGAGNPLGLAPVSKAAVLVIDGLGAGNLELRKGHARWLTAAWRVRGLTADVGFPSTTASALTTLTTGVHPGEHGIVGYTIRDPQSTELINHLKEWEPHVDPASWQRAPTLFQQASDEGIPCLSMGEHRFAGSDFTKAVWRGSTFVGTGSLAEQWEKLREFFDTHDRGLAYLYWPALDRIGHSSGVQSEAWVRRLEDLDQNLREVGSLLKDDEGLIITADHGMVDVEDNDKLMVREDSALLHGIAAWGGEPRAAHLYAVDPGSTGDVVAAWAETLKDRAIVMTREQVLDEGLYGEVAPEVRARIGDVLVLATSGSAFYRLEVASPQSMRMVGQHGSITVTERQVPVVPLGAWV